MLHLEVETKLPNSLRPHIDEVHSVSYIHGMKTIMLATILVLILTGCATALSERASQIQVITPDDAENCQFIANVSASSNLTGLARHTGYQSAMNEVLDRAAAAGATSVVLDPHSEPSYWTTSEIVRGVAYKCSK